MYLLNNFNHQIYRSDTYTRTFLVRLFYQSNLMVLFMVGKKTNVKKVTIKTLTMKNTKFDW